MKIKFLLIAFLSLTVSGIYAQTTRIQFINNCADQSISGVDIYINGQLAMPPTFDNISFRTSTQFIDIPAGAPITVGVAPENSFDVADTFYSKVVSISQLNNYIFVLNGIESQSGYTPLVPLTLDVYSMAREAASAGFTDVLFLNAATDAPDFDLRTGITNIADDITYGEFSNYRTLSSNLDYKFRLTNPAGTQIEHNFDAPFSTHNVSGAAVTVMTSGFLNPGSNSNGPAFGLWMSLPMGGQLIELTASNEYEPLSRVQLIHNSADTSVGKIDVFVNGEKMVDTLDYHYATPYMDAFAGVPLSVAFVHSGSPSPFFNMDINLDSGKVYSAIIHGIESDTNYKPIEPLTIGLFNGAKETTTAGNGEAILFHGCTDAPVTNPRHALFTPITQFAAMEYGDFSSGYYTMNQPDVLRVDTGATSPNPVADYALQGPGINFGSKTITLTYSGFVTPDSNSGGPTFGVWAAEPSGGKMIELPLYVSVSNLNSVAKEINIYPNPAGEYINLELPTQHNNIIITDMTGKVIKQLSDHSGNSIPISDIMPGAYLLFSESGGNVYNAKFIKK